MLVGLVGPSTVHWHITALEGSGISFVAFSFWWFYWLAFDLFLEFVGQKGVCISCLGCSGLYLELSSHRFQSVIRIDAFSTKYSGMPSAIGLFISCKKCESQSTS